MAVYTVLEAAFIHDFVQPYGVGPVCAHQGIGDGIENTNYFVTTDVSRLPSETSTANTREFVLTVFEELPYPAVEFYLDWLETLDRAGVPVAAALVDNQGNKLQRIEGKPAALFPRIPGRHLDTPNLEQARSVGRALAKTHLVALEQQRQHDSAKDFAWVKRNIELLLPHLNADEAQLLQQGWQHASAKLAGYNLPSGIIHTDLFRDNALFVGDQLSSILDFYSAGNGALSYDLAVVVNDWASKPDGQLDDERLAAIIDGYDAIRPRNDDEHQCWPALLQLAAIRFWSSRLLDIHLPSSDHRAGALTHIKDPELYKNILLQRQKL